VPLQFLDALPLWVKTRHCRHGVERPQTEKNSSKNFIAEGVAELRSRDL